MEEIEQIVASEKPPERINKKFCKTCSYYELCWVNQ
jgi:CRISPR-associated exonuclease Cas4